MKAQGVLKGVIMGIVCSLVIPFLFINVTQGFAGGHTNYFGESWLYIAISIPLILSLGIAGHYLSIKKNITNKKMWGVSFFIALIVSLFTSTLGVLLSEILLRGNLDTLNVEGSMVAGVIYSVVFLPITVPLGKLVINYLQKWI